MKHFEGFIASQALWNQTQFGVEQFKIPDFDVSSFTPAAIPSHLRLGHQIELIFHQIVQHHPDYEILAHSLQVKGPKRTLGELDFLISYQKHIFHIELSYKFYIIDPTISEPIHRLMGPNRRDMFFTKLEKTKNQQLPLLYSKECLPLLQKLEINPNKVIQQVCFLGQLFVPLKTDTISIQPLNKQCIIGSWMQMKDFENISFRQSLYYIPKKYEWLHLPHLEVSWQNHFDTLKEVNTSHTAQRSPMLWRKLPDGTIDKFFVVWW